MIDNSNKARTTCLVTLKMKTIADCVLPWKVSSTGTTVVNNLKVISRMSSPEVLLTCRSCNEVVSFFLKQINFDVLRISQGEYLYCNNQLQVVDISNCVSSYSEERNRQQHAYRLGKSAAPELPQCEMFNATKDYNCVQNIYRTEQTAR